ncbi:MAG: ATP synthase F1 subunit epsilon, partial [Pseudomonadota bacterium]
LVTIPCSEGEIGVMFNHISLISLLKTGLISANFKNSGDKKICIDQGFVDINNNICNILIDEAFDISDLDIDQINDKISAIKKLLSASNDKKKNDEFQRKIEFLEFLLDVI